MYQNIYEFVQGIDSDNLPHDISHHFDQVVALYYLVGGRSDIDIRIFEENKKVIFSLLLEREQDAKVLNSILNGNFIVVFNKRYFIESSISGDSLIVSFIKDKTY